MAANANMTMNMVGVHSRQLKETGDDSDKAADTPESKEDIANDVVVDEPSECSNSDDGAITSGNSTNGTYSAYSTARSDSKRSKYCN